MTKEDRRTGRQTGKGGVGEAGELRVGDVPSRRISPCTLLSYEGSFPSRWPQRREEEGEGGVRILGFFFFSPVVPRTAQQPLGVKGEGVGVKWGGTGCATPDGPKWTAQSDDRWKVVGVVKVKINVTQDGPKWTASSE